MAQQNDVERFKTGEEFIYPVNYLGEGSAWNRIPGFILKKTMPLPGFLIYSNRSVDFRLPKPANYDDDFVFEFEFSVPLWHLEGEQACAVDKILFITLSPHHGPHIRYYFDVSEDAIYRPPWIAIGKE